MNEEIEQSLTTIVNYIEQGATFAVEQMPHIVMEILHFGMALNSLMMVFFGGLAVLMVTTRKQFDTWVMDDSFNRDIAWGPWCVVLLFSVVVVGFSAVALAKIVYAPRLYILGYISNLVS